MGRKRAISESEMPLYDAVDAALNDIGELRDEMEEWRDNLDSANMSHMPKYDEVSSAVDDLDSATNQIGPDDTPDVLRRVPVKFTQSTKKRMSRGDRMANAAPCIKYFGRHIPGQPNVVPTFMPGAGGAVGMNYLVQLTRSAIRPRR